MQIKGRAGCSSFSFWDTKVDTFNLKLAETSYLLLSKLSLTQDSLGNKTVVELLSASVITHNFSPSFVRQADRIRKFIETEQSF